jgi:UDP-glucose:glycoprotein glucosyltransferase
MRSDLPAGIFDTPTYSRRRSYELLNSEIGVIELGSIEDAVFQFAITLNPLSEAAQKWSAIIKVLSEIAGVHVRVYLNPQSTTTELPLKRFYRYVFSKSIHFASDG